MDAFRNRGQPAPTFREGQQVRLVAGQWPQRFSRRYGKVISIDYRPEFNYAAPDGYLYTVQLLNGTQVMANSEGIVAL